MPRFFVEQALLPGISVTISGEDAHHISRALRMRPGEKITLCGSEGLPHEGVLLSLNRETVQVQLGDPLLVTGEPNVSVTLLVGMPKQDKLALIIQKAVELGASEIIPFFSARTVVRLPDAGKEKLPRWQKIAREAAMQCGRGKIPRVRPVVSFDQALAIAKESDTPLFCYEESVGTVPLSSVLNSCSLSSISALIGPEGGFAPEEAEKARQAGLTLVSLGSRILRCETAPLCLLSAVLYAAGEL